MNDIGPSEAEDLGYYNGEPVFTPARSRSDAEKLALLDWHPIFTGRCPACERVIVQIVPPRAHWDCSNCGWKDDTI